jgi:hypothetical protein
MAMMEEEQEEKSGRCLQKGMFTCIEGKNSPD